MRELERQSVKAPTLPHSHAPDAPTIPPPTLRRSHGFSLVELIGVLAVIAILSALLVPRVLQQMDEAARAKEVSDLNAISNALVLQIIGTNGTKRIPSQADWAQSVANWARQPVAKASKNPRGYDRVFLIDTSGWFGSAIGTLPYAQTTNGTTNPPVNARLMIVSRIGGPVLPVTNGAPATSTFNNTWNTADRAKPTSWTGSLSWGGKGDDLVIQRMNLEPLFHRLVLVNRDPPGNALFSIGSTNTTTLTNIHASYYLDGTDVGLYSGTNPPIAQLRVLLDQDRSLFFQGGLWFGDFDPASEYNKVVGSDFAALAGDFLSAEWADSSHKGGNQQGVVLAMYNFMLTYQLWANQCPHFPTHGQNRNNVPEYLLMLDVAGNGSSSLLNSFSGTDGLLK
jgi:prepilin-type N-terminal cleavage/methylation domain-containing protein